MPETSPPGYGALAALVLFIAASVWLGTVAQRAVQKGSFLKSYFLGGRGLGAWALALTATVQSGGTFMGFPSLVYTHGWVVTLWIASYMVVPISGFGVLAKRFSQLSRRTGAITIPDLFRERFGSPTVGLVASLLILFFMSFMMVAQFKAGATVMKVAWPGTGALSFSDDADPYQLSTEALSRLKADGLPGDKLDKLEPLRGKGFSSAGEMSKALTGVLHPGREAILDDDAGDMKKIVARAEQFDWLFLVGLAIFTVTVVGYTMIGGFLAAVWTDLFQSVMMFIGVVILLSLSLYWVGGIESATMQAVANTGPAFATGPGYSVDGREFLTPGLAFSFFFVWVFAGMGSPASMVRVMACKDTATIRRSVFLLGSYNMLIYLPLIIICIAARAVMPNLAVSDEVIPRMALWTTREIPGGTFLAGLILAAPFGAVMATVSSYLVVIASGLVRDIYQRFINPVANERTIRRLTYAVMIIVGLVAVGFNIRPVAFLQAIVVFCGEGGASTFVVPAVMAAYWRRATVQGVLAAMLSGAGVSVALLIAGLIADDPHIGQGGQFRSYYYLGLGPIVWGLTASLLAGLSVSLLTRPPEEALVSRLFDAQESVPAI